MLPLNDEEELCQNCGQWDMTVLTIGIERAMNEATAVYEQGIYLGATIIEQIRD